MAILDTILQQLNIWDGQLLLFIQNHLRSETLNPIVIAVTNLGNAGIFWDLHHDETLNQGNVMTEYEQKFSSMGNPICKMIISR